MGGFFSKQEKKFFLLGGEELSFYTWDRRNFIVARNKVEKRNDLIVEQCGAFVEPGGAEHSSIQWYHYDIIGDIRETNRID
jgi:hypothetical protein